MCWTAEEIYKEVDMAIVILLALILFSGGLASILLRRHAAELLPGPIPDNVIHIADWGAALQQRRHRAGLHIFDEGDAVTVRPAG